jgi:hypothetical protein
VYWIVSQRAGGLAVDVERGWSEGILMVEIGQQSAKPGNVLSCVVSRDVFGLHRGCCNNRLRPGHPGDRSTTQENDRARDGAASDGTCSSITVGVGVHVQGLAMINESVVRGASEVVQQTSESPPGTLDMLV